MSRYTVAPLFERDPAPDLDGLWSAPIDPDRGRESCVTVAITFGAVGVRILHLTQCQDKTAGNWRSVASQDQR